MFKPSWKSDGSGRAPEERTLNSFDVENESIMPSKRHRTHTVIIIHTNSGRIHCEKIMLRMSLASPNSNTIFCLPFAFVRTSVVSKGYMFVHMNMTYRPCASENESQIRKTKRASCSTNTMYWRVAIWTKSPELAEPFRCEQHQVTKWQVNVREHRISMRAFTWKRRTISQCKTE